LINATRLEGDIDAHYYGYYNRDQANQPTFSGANWFPKLSPAGEKILVRAYFDRTDRVSSRR
jgi:hypothetical protein